MPEATSWIIPEETHKTIVHGITNHFSFTSALSYELHDDGKVQARYGKDINPADSYYNGRHPNPGDIFDLAIKEKKEQYVLNPLEYPCRDLNIKEKHHQAEPFVLIPIEIDHKVVLLISINNCELISPIHQSKLDGFKNFARDILSADEKNEKEGLLALNIQTIIDKAENFKIGTLIRNYNTLGVNKLNEKAIITQLIIEAQNKKNIFPYDRFLKRGSNSSSLVASPDENTEKECIVWTNNHYLGLNRNLEVIKYARAILEEYGTGCGTSAVSGGFSTIHKILEQTLSGFVEKPGTVLYPTGFTANLGAISALVNKNDLIIVDRENHASIIDGLKMSGADFRVFKHNNPENLEHIIKTTDNGKYNNIMVVTESVFSMSGEEAPLKDYCKLKEKYGFYLYVDEAHAFGFYGERGSGLVEHLACTDQVDFVMSTLSKATASVGGFVATDKHYCSYLRLNSNPYLFQACLTPVDAAVSIAALKIILNDKTFAERLWNNTNLFRRLLMAQGFDVGKGKSPIVPLYVSDEAKLSILCKELYKNGIFTNWVSYPVVAKNRGRLRFVVTANHTEQQIKKTAEMLEYLCRRISII